MRKVLIGTPSYDGKLGAHYVDSLWRTIMLCAANNIQVSPLFICYDALVQRARNDIMYVAYNEMFDDLVFIDADMGWNPEDFLKLLSHDVDVVGGTARKKSSVEQYVVKVIPENGLKKEENGLIKVAGIGTGFMRLSKEAIQCLWAYPFNSDYIENDINKKMIFNVTVDDEQIVSEDITICNKLYSLGLKIYLDPTITCSHTGTETYFGNFEEWAKKLKSTD